MSAGSMSHRRSDQTLETVRREPRPGITLAIILCCQLMVVLDATIVNIALPKIQGAFHFSSVNLSWVLTGYTLAFGGLLLLGGRSGDILGRRRMFVTGLAIFAVASLAGGLAVGGWLLLTARALQGVGAALASPSALALVTTNFPEGPERAKALGAWAAVSGTGGAIGLILGGVLTTWLSWRAVMFINVPIALAAILLTPRFINESERHTGRFDLAGAITSTVGLAALVYGLIHAASNGWSDPTSVGALALAVLVLAIFVFVEMHADQPIVPLTLVRNLNRIRTYLMILLVVASMLGMFFFLTQFLQEVLGLSPIRAGLAFLPMSVALMVSAQRTSKVLPRLGPKPPMLLGAAITTAGMLWLTQISETTGYVGGVLGPTLAFGIGVGMVYVPLTVSAVSGVPRRESGAASSMMNVMSQVGGTLGLAILVTVFGTVSKHSAQHLPAGLSASQQTRHVLADAMSGAFWVSALFFAIVLVAALLVKGARPAAPATATPQPVGEPTAQPGVGTASVDTPSQKS